MKALPKPKPRLDRITVYLDADTHLALHQRSRDCGLDLGVAIRGILRWADGRQAQPPFPLPVQGQPTLEPSPQAKPAAPPFATNEVSSPAQARAHAQVLLQAQPQAQAPAQPQPDPQGWTITEPGRIDGEPLHLEATFHGPLGKRWFKPHFDFDLKAGWRAVMAINMGVMHMVVHNNFDVAAWSHKATPGHADALAWARAHAPNTEPTPDLIQGPARAVNGYPLTQDEVGMYVRRAGGDSVGVDLMVYDKERGTLKTASEVPKPVARAAGLFESAPREDQVRTNPVVTVAMTFPKHDPVRVDALDGMDDGPASQAVRHALSRLDLVEDRVVLDAIHDSGLVLGDGRGTIECQIADHKVQVRGGAVYWERHGQWQPVSGRQIRAVVDRAHTLNQRWLDWGSAPPRLLPEDETGQLWFYVEPCLKHWGWLRSYFEQVESAAFKLGAPQPRDTGAFCKELGLVHEVPVYSQAFWRLFLQAANQLQEDGTLQPMDLESLVRSFL